MFAQLTSGVLVARTYSRALRRRKWEKARKSGATVDQGQGDTLAGERGNVRDVRRKGKKERLEGGNKDCMGQKKKKGRRRRREEKKNPCSHRRERASRKGSGEKEAPISKSQNGHSKQSILRTQTKRVSASLSQKGKSTTEKTCFRQK